jgi:predicted PurR-regulated permease PerM
MLDSSAVGPKPRPFRKLTAFLWIIVIAILVAFGYFASSLCITFLLAGFLAILLDPIPTALESWRVPRTMSSALVVLSGMAVMGLLLYAFYGKASSFVDDMPQYASRVRDAITPVSRNIERMQRSAGTLAAAEPTKKVPEVRINQPPNWPSYLVRGVSSVWGAVIIAGVVPFLTFFMLVRKAHIYSWLLNAFGQRADIPRFVGRLTQMVRGFVTGNVIIGSVMAGMTVAVLVGLHMPGAVPLGIASGFLSLVPFVGGILALLLPLMAATLQFSTPGPFILICLTVGLLHLVSANLLIPKWIGARVNIGPVAATVGLLFWGWLWGVMGILLAVPLTAFMKLAADCHPSLIHVSNLLAETPHPVATRAYGVPISLARAIPFFRRRLRPSDKGE